MEIHEAKLKRYMLKKYGTEDNLNLNKLSILDIQAYAAAEVQSIMAKGSSITLSTLYSYLCTAPLSYSYVFWLSCYCEILSDKTFALPGTDPKDIVKLLFVFFEKDENKAYIIQNSIDTELINAYVSSDIKAKIGILIELLISDIENELAKTQNNVFKFSKEYIFRWLIHLFNLLHKEGLDTEAVILRSGNLGINMILAFEVAAHFFPMYKDSIFTSTLMQIIIRFLIVLIENSKALISAKTFLTNSLWEFSKASGITLREKAEIYHTFHASFMEMPEIIDSVYYWDALSDGLAAEDAMIRKYSMTLVKDHLQGFLQENKDPNKKEISDLWVAFFDIYDTYESFGCHLSKSIWDRVGSFFTYLDKTKQTVEEHGRKDALTNMTRWLQALLLRIQTLENVKLKKYIVKYLLKKGKYPVQLHSYFLTSFFKLLNTPVFYREGVTNKNVNSVPSLIPNFIQSLIENSEGNVGELSKLVLKGVHDLIDNAFALTKIVQGLTLVKHTEKYIGTKELLLIQEIIDLKTREFYESRRFMLSKSLIVILNRHIDPTNYQLPDLLNTLAYIPTPFYITKVSNADILDPKYKEMLEEIINTNDIEKVFLEISRIMTKAPKIESLKAFISLSKIFAVLSKKVQFSVPSNELYKKIDKVALDMFQQIAHNLASTYSNGNLVIFMLCHLRKFVHVLLRVVPDDCIKLFIGHFDNYLAAPLSEYLLNTLMLFMNPTSVQASSKDRLVLFAKHNEQIYGLLSDVVSLLHIVSGTPSLKLNKLFSFTLTQATQLVCNCVEGKKCSSIALGMALAQTEALISSYSSTIESKSSKTVLVFEGIFEVLPKLLSGLGSANYEETAFDTTYDGVFKGIVSPGEAVKIASTAQWKIIKELIVIAGIDHSLDKIISEKGKAIITNICKNCLPFSVGKMLQVLFDVFALCLSRIYLGVSTLTEEDMQGYCDLLKQCWSIYEKDVNSPHRTVITPLVELSIHPILFSHSSLRNFPPYQTMLSEILDNADRSWLITRAILGQLAPILALHPAYVTGSEEMLFKLSVLVEHRGEDSAVILPKAFFNVSQAINKKIIYYEEIDFYGAFVRVAMFELFERIILTTKEQMLKAGWTNFTKEQDKEAINKKYEQYIVVIEFITKLMISMMDLFVKRTKKERSVPMTYTAEYRLRLRIGQYVCVLIQIFDKDILTDYFRKCLCEVDPIEIMIERLKGALELNNAPILRNFIEIATAKFALGFPEDVLPKLIIPNMIDLKSNVQMRNSSVFVACLVLDKLTDEKFQELLLKNLIIHIGSHSAFSRAMAQVFITKHASKFKESDKKFLEPYFLYGKEDKTAAKITEKIMKQLEDTTAILNKTSAEMILTSRLNDFGEFFHMSFIELIRNSLAGIMTVYKDEEGVSGEYLWKQDLKLRLANNPDYERELLEVAEKSQNYQRKILPWEQVEETYEEMKFKQDKRKRNDIILVATLIEKVPNLGGLCRTCEIFNVSALVVPSIRIMEDHVFKSLSMSSEKWQPLYEVSPKELHQYLIYQKSKGYKLLGLEQTAKSFMLQKYKFPEKCILLLGEERSGIPIEHLKLLDDCIEIPQMGIVRSLNVHVSGAICLWEYSKQMCFNN